MGLGGFAGITAALYLSPHGQNGTSIRTKGRA